LKSEDRSRNSSSFWLPTSNHKIYRNWKSCNKSA